MTHAPARCLVLAALSTALTAPALAGSPACDVFDLYGCANEISSAGSSATAFAVDVNTDGLADIVSSDGTATYVSYNAGSGNFDARVNIAFLSLLGRGPVDLDADGRLDLIVGDAGGNEFILYGSPAGGFDAPVALDGDIAALADSTAADLDGDGLPELIAADRVGSSSTIRVWDNLGGRVLVQRAPLPSQSFVSSCVAADFNGDGLADIASSNFRSDATIRVWINDGAGGFGAPSTYEINPFVRSILATDFNEDGTADLIVAHRGGDELTYFIGGSGGLSSETVLSATVAQGDLTLADVNHDGVQDLCYGGESGRVLVRLGLAGPGAFTGEFSYFSAFSIRAMHIADFDGNGLPDFLTVHDVQQGEDSVRVQLSLCDLVRCNRSDLAEPFGVLDVSDVNKFVGRFLEGSVEADVSRPYCALDLADLGRFVGDFVAGCP